MISLKKKLPEEGHFVDSFKTVVLSDCEYLDEHGDILFVFRKNVIPEDLAELARKTFTKVAQKKNDNRGTAAGLLPSGSAKEVDKYGVARGNIARSNIVGYFDKPNIRDKKKFPGKSVCRLTSFNAKNRDLFDKTVPFFQCIDRVYRECAPDHYQRQLTQAQKCHPDLLVRDTVFSTVTCNYNWRTACHTDKGDFKAGLGNLTVIGDHEGGLIGFPEYDVGVSVQSRDVLLMNVHKMHCNTAITSGERLSFVCYLREGMHRCTQRVDDVFFTS
jgi:hypothetical protein